MSFSKRIIKASKRLSDLLNAATQTYEQVTAIEEEICAQMDTLRKERDEANQVRTFAENLLKLSKQ